MTTVRTILREIKDLEGFRVRVRSVDGSKVDLNENGVLKSYPYLRKFPDTGSAHAYKKRFARTYPGYYCEVMLRGGIKAGPGMHLDKVRSTY